MTARILVVDDIPANVKLLEARLLAEYFDVLTAENGYECLDICGKVPVDVILLDIMMPGMDGFEVCERLKANPKTSHIPVVMVTSSREEQDLVRSYELGVNAYVVKPVDFQKFVESIKQVGFFWAVINEPAPVSTKPGD